MFFKKAQEDPILIRKLVSDIEISDGTWGFHAHQALEKLIKAILVKNKVQFPKSHDLVFLFETLPQHILPIFNTVSDDCENLNPFAVALRYDDVIDVTIDRNEILKRIADLSLKVESLLK
jgi:HEPN domain-containing protein